MTLTRLTTSCLLLYVITLSANVFVFTSAAAGNVTRTKVLVLGAGAAGVSFANTLSENGITDFLILEAYSRVGGRIKDTKFGSLTIQEGAAWIHDVSAKNPFYVMKTKMGLNTTQDDYSDFIVRNTEGKLENTSKIVYQDLKAKIEKMYTLNEEMQKMKESDIPLRTALQIVNWNAKTKLQKAIEYYMVDFESGMPAWILSPQQVGFTGDGKDEIVTDSRGYAYILREVAKAFTNKIRLNTTVTSITYNDKTVTVETSKGMTYVADYAYVTFSTGVLASDTVKFKPALPQWKMKAALMLPMAQYTKIFLKFPTKFWDNNRYFLVASDKQGYYTHFQNMDRVGLFPGEKMLVATVTGFESLRVEQLTDTEVKAEIMPVLKKVYPSATNATDIFVTRWSKDPTAFGAYSAPVPGTDDYTYKHLKAPVNKTLWFGGEAATDSDDFGYAHGAYRGAKAQALQLIKCMKDAKTCPVYKVRPKPCPITKGGGAVRSESSVALSIILLLSIINVIY